MRRINKVLLLFLMMIFIISATIWSFLQSDTFGSLLSSIINEYSMKAGVEVQVQKINFNFFPPGGKIKGVHFIHKIKENSIEAELDELVIHLGFWNFWNDRPHLKNIAFRQGTVELKGDWAKSDQDKDENKSRKFDLTKDFKRVQNIVDLLPVKISGLEMERVQFRAINGKYQVYFNNLDLAREGKKFKLKVNAFPEVPLRSFKKPILVDQIQGILKFDAEKMDFKKLRLQMGANQVLVKGEVNHFLNKEKLNFKLNGDILAQLDDLEDFIRIGSEKVFLQGLVEGEYNISGNLENFDGALQASVEKVFTPYIRINEGIVNASINSDAIIVNEVRGKYYSGDVKLLKPFTFANFRKKEILQDPIHLDARKFPITNVTRAVESLKVLKGKFSGPVVLTAGKKSFRISSDQLIQFHRLRIEEEEAIVELPEVMTNQLNIFIDDGDTDININFDSPTLIGKLKGQVVNGLGKFEVYNALLDFNKINLLNKKLPFTGQGTLNFIAQTGPDKQILDLSGIIDDATLLKFNLSKLSTKLRFLFHENRIEFNQFDSQFGQDRIFGKGSLNWKKKNQDFDFKISKINYRNFVYLFKNYISDVYYFPESTTTKLSGQFKTSGGISFEDLILKGRLYASGGEHFGEKFSYGYMDIDLERQRGLFHNMLIKKAGSDIKGNFTYDFKKQKFSYDYRFDYLATQNINFFSTYLPNLNSNLAGRMTGSNMRGEDFLFDFSFSESQIKDKKFAPSKFKFKMRNNVHYLTGNLFGDKVDLDLKFDLNERSGSQQKNSKMNVSTKLNRVENIIEALPTEYINPSNFTFDLDLVTKINFNYNDWRKVKLNSNVRKIKLITEKMNLDYQSDQEQFKVYNSKIVNWDFRAKGKNISVESEASGNLGGTLKISNIANFDLSVLSSIFRKVQKSSGAMKLIYDIKEKGELWSHELGAKSSSFSLVTNLLPFNFKKGLFDIRYQKEKLEIKKFQSALSEGAMATRGSLDFSEFPPALNVQYNLMRAGFKVFQKSKLFFTGNGALLGRKPPYILSGNLRVDRSYINDEFQDIIEDNQNYVQDVKFLPKNSATQDVQLAQLNIDLKTDDYIAISNSLTDTKVRAQGNLTGSFDKFYFDGFVRLFGNRNRVYFKGAEYNIKKMDLLLSSDRDLSDPEIDAWAFSTISDYDIDIKAYGRKDDLNFSLSSEPSLSQNDIISLVAFGYTNKISNDLSSESREALTRAGIGSFVFDQIGLNKTLKREFGLQLSLGTEFQNDENLLNQRTGNSVGRVRSATKIEVKKDITDKVDLSLSTTVGGNIGETRSMNLNYDLKDNVSVEGVYEIINNQQGDTNRVGNSAGADLKFKWEFK